MPRVHVRLTGGTCPVDVGPGLLESAGARLREMGATGVGVVTDEHVRPLHAERLLNSLRQAGFVPAVATVPAGEAAKTFDGFACVHDALLPARPDRRWVVVSLGGGCVTDLGGFAAATLLRGVRHVPAPTTLLAMVDAAVGGKTGINHGCGKNLIGAFHQPTQVWCDVDTLATLPDAEFRGGLAECVKHDVIRDAAHFARFEAEADGILSRDPATLADLVAHNVTVKARVVEADPFEHNERAHLNFGHTFGHAIEKVSGYTIGHGQAVSLGMTCAVRLSRALGLAGDDDATRVVGLLDRLGLPTGGLPYAPPAVVAAMSGDKKASAGRLRFVVCPGLGRATVRDDVPEAAVLDAAASVCRDA